MAEGREAYVSCLDARIQSIETTVGVMERAAAALEAGERVWLVARVREMAALQREAEAWARGWAVQGVTEWDAELARAERERKAAEWRASMADEQALTAASFAEREAAAARASQEKAAAWMWKKVADAARGVGPLEHPDGSFSLIPCSITWVKEAAELTADVFGGVSQAAEAVADVLEAAGAAPAETAIVAAREAAATARAEAARQRAIVVDRDVEGMAATARAAAALGDQSMELIAKCLDKFTETIELNGRIMDGPAETLEDLADRLDRAEGEQ